jgi:CubicO group peptidase (beta-lactamase class C family)
MLAGSAVAGDGWKIASLEAAGMDRQPIEAMTAEIRRYPDWNIHAVLIEHDGRLVYEEYFAGEDQKWGQSLGTVVFTRDTKHDLRSVTKSVTSALVGIALASGKLRSLDQPLLDFFPEQAAAGRTGQPRISVRHALMMSAGLDWNEDIPYTDPRNDEIAMTRSKDPAGYVLTRPRVAEAGTVWKYNGGLPQVLATIVQRTTGKPLRDYARTVLFAPLGIRDFEWVGDLALMPSAASGLRLRPRDLAKFGSLYLHDGQWNERQVVPANWVRESTRRQIALPTPVSAYGTHGYGYLWWHTRYRTAVGTLEVPWASGNGQQRIIVVPELHIVVTILAGRYNDPTAGGLPERLLLEQIIPAVRGPRSASAGTGCTQ